MLKMVLLSGLVLWGVLFTSKTLASSNFSILWRR